MDHQNPFYFQLTIKVHAYNSMDFQFFSNNLIITIKQVGAYDCFLKQPLFHRSLFL